MTRPFVIFELANNHQGDVEHGLLVIHEVAKVCQPYRDRVDFGLKLQYRHLETFIRPDATDDMPHVKRFRETALKDEDLYSLRIAAATVGFKSVCTPFDERSVALLWNHRHDVVKVASCSIADWPLLEEIGADKEDRPVIVSTAGASLEEIDRVVSFFQHRGRDRLTLLHCVARYPTLPDQMELNQIDLLRSRYPGVPIGLSSHEANVNSMTITAAVAKGCLTFERHVGMRTEKHPTLNEYSLSPCDLELYLRVLCQALAICGQAEGRPHCPHEKESLRSLKRGAFAFANRYVGEPVEPVTLAFPPGPGQLTADSCSKYVRKIASRSIMYGEPLTEENTERMDRRDWVRSVLYRVLALVRQSGAVLPASAEVEISHHRGVEQFERTGCVLFTVVNRESYCKKIIVLLPGQEHPEQWHERKEETFVVLWGDLCLKKSNWLGEQNMITGDAETISPSIKHYFRSNGGCVIEEVSTHHDPADSHYTDPAIQNNPNRKTRVQYWSNP